jgi:hypothetical protein
MFNVCGLEPASVVLCEGDEVDLEFDYSLITLPDIPIVRPPSPFPHDLIPELLSPEPSAPPALPETPSLGGIKREERFNPWRNKDFKPTTS